MKQNLKFMVPYIINCLIALTASATTVAPAHSTPDDGPVKSDISAEREAPRDSAIADIDIPPYAIDAYRQNKGVMYIMSTGDTICRTGGTLAWRNNNPGNLKYGDFARQNGSIGKGQKDFAIFPDEDTGRAALCALLQSKEYNKLTLARMIAKYAPPHENNTASYCKCLRKATGLSLNTQICDLNPTQMKKVTDLICKIEGWKEGLTINHR